LVASEGIYRRIAMRAASIIAILLLQTRIHDFRQKSKESSKTLAGSRGLGELRHKGDRSVHSNVDNDHYAQRDEHVEASRIEDVPEPHDGR
jgi:hypothetical protein